MPLSTGPDLFHWRGWRVLSLLLVAALFLAPALWNGYPLIYYDTEDYVEMSFTWQPIIWRIMTYGAFTWIGHPFGTLWAVAWAQALIGAWIMHEAVWAWVARYRPQVYVLMGVIVALFTGLPWVVSQILADMFAGFAILGLAVLAFGDNLSRPRRLALVPLVAVGICLHMSHVAVAAGLLIAMTGLRLLSRLSLRLPRPRLLLPTLTVALGTAAVPGLHWAVTGQAFFTQSGQVLQLALFVQDGLAKKYLDEVCPNGATFKMCAHKEGLPYTADEFLWGDSAFDDLGGWKAMHDEAGAIVSGAIKTFPADVARAMARNTITQIDLIGSGEDLVPMSWHFVKTVLKRYPRDFRSFRFAMQQRAEGIDFTLINQIQVPVAQAAQVALFGLLVVAWRRRDRISAGLLVTVILAIIGNAVVCGALSNPHDRYQNRLVWLALFACSVAAIRLDQRFTRRKSVPPI
ncbi:hypothetical protein [Magnetospirillum moscoviense]|uniref:Glycosyltransferase RgtA/B/C/D-like domain-containing protein n=1 Tax=Magnetospirillum moscoviense TaxID=1437059 RepID=A0A178MQ65_9PROT|nr:hypothetical protein [Magnetospirillum moscoviense]OAN50094.1 hypothetical protein A6A05_02470 [Magnetospirillum moscoviense]